MNQGPTTTWVITFRANFILQTLYLNHFHSLFAWTHALVATFSARSY